MADRHGTRFVVNVGITVLVVSYVSLWGAVEAPLTTVAHIAALAVGVIVLDVGAQMVQVANQTRIFGLVASARSRLNTCYMVVYFTGAAVGSWLSSLAWSHFRWNGVCLLALGFIALATLRHITGVRTPRRGDSSPSVAQDCIEA
jgi:predicted MFS family arabinose efflux permease